LIRWPNTKLRLWWWDGTKARITTMTATPNTCQNTEMLLNRATSGELKMLISAWTTRMITNSRNVSWSTCALSPKLIPRTFSRYRPSVRSRNVAAP